MACTAGLEALRPLRPRPREGYADPRCGGGARARALAFSGQVCGGPCRQSACSWWQASGSVGWSSLRCLASRVRRMGRGMDAGKSQALFCISSRQTTSLPAQLPSVVSVSSRRPEKGWKGACLACGCRLGFPVVPPRHSSDHTYTTTPAPPPRHHLSGMQCFFRPLPVLAALPDLSLVTDW